MTGYQMSRVVSYLWIAAGGALGSVARHWLSGIVARHSGDGFPWGTILVNVSGSFAIGFFASYFGPEGRVPIPAETRQFVMIGILGGYTTFSAFSLQTLDLARNGHWLAAAANVIGSVALCLLAVWLGHLIATAASR